MANEKRLIDANALIANLRTFKGLGAMVAESLVRFTEKQPTVDAVEVVHGRWIAEKCDHVPWRLKNPEKWVIHKCSVCGYSNGRKHSNYCPNCGAKMDGGNEDGNL